MMSQDRVIVVAIAPGAIVPDNICFQSFNYASTRDIVHYGELVFAGLLDNTEVGISKTYKMILANHEQLILLEPHVDATGIDHDFQSPTFAKSIKYHINGYLEQNGRYKDTEKLK